MPQEPKHPSQGDRPAAERQLAATAPVRQFIDREEFVAPVQSALKEPPRTKPLVLVYYGGAGIGKSRLRQELVKQLCGDPGVITATLDFAMPIYRQPDTALFFLRNSIREAYQVKFPSFDLAYAVYRQKTHPDTAMGLPPFSEGLARLSVEENRACTQSRSQNGGCTQQETATAPCEELRPLFGPGSPLSQLLDESGKLPLIGLVPKIATLLRDQEIEGSRDRVKETPTSNLPPSTYYLDWWEKRGERELEDLPQMEPAAIVEQLPKLWASDLKDELQHGSRESRVENSEAGDHSPLSTPHSRSAVLFVDSYEKLWETAGSRQEAVDRGQKIDEWVRELVKQLSEALWIVCGRQKLRWEEVDEDWDTSLSQHELGALPDESARRFLTSCGITNEPIQDAIVKGSQGVPHYLDLAVDTVERTKDEGQRTKLTGDNPDELVKQFVRHLDQPEIETLQVLSGPRFWYYGLFENLMTEYQTGYPVTAYEDLARFSFVSEGAAPGTRTMHELMREALQESQSPELRKRVHLFLHELYAKQLQGFDVKRITDKHRTALTEAFYHGRQAKSAKELDAWLETAKHVFEMAHESRLLAPLYREMVQVFQNGSEPDRSGEAGALCSLATMLKFQGEYEEVESLYRRALALAEKGCSPQAPILLDCLYGLALVLVDLARHGEAAALYHRAAAMFDVPGVDVHDRADALRALAGALAIEGKHAEAEEAFRRSIAIYESEQARQLGQHHGSGIKESQLWLPMNLSFALRDLAGLLARQFRFVEAESLNRRALAIREESFGANHPDVGQSLQNLAVDLLNLCRYAEAEPLLRRALKLYERALGPNHDRTALAMNNLGFLLADLGRYPEAEMLHRQALAVHTKKKGPHHLFTIRIARNLIRVLVEQGRYAEAEPMVLNAITAREEKLGPDHPETATVLHWAGVMYNGLGRYAEAESYLLRAHVTRTKALGPEHLDTLRSLGEMALLEDRRGNFAEAEMICRGLLEKRERALGSEHPDVAGTANLLAGICSRDGRYAESEALYRRALAIREKVFGPDHPFLAETLEGLAKVYDQTRRTAEAQELAARAARIRAQVPSAPGTPQ
jgi:tetratricopeptide (TPR) repeat protein